MLPCVDSRWIAQTFAFRREVTKPVPLNDKWLIPGHAYGSVLRDRQGQWRMWYLNDPIYCGYYAQSTDGITWDQPELDFNLQASDRAKLAGNAYMVSPQKDSRGNWLVYGQGPEGFCVLDAELTPHPAAKARFTALYLSKLPSSNGEDISGLFIAYSDDGIHWLSGGRNPVIQGWHDTNNMFFFDKRIGRYVLYGRPDACVSHVTHANRLIARCESDDLIHWTPYRTVLDTDDLDAAPLDHIDEAEMIARAKVDASQRTQAWQRVTEGATVDTRALIRGRNRQWYGINVFPYADIYLGIGMLYDVPTGHMWLELLHSYDGIDWRREHKRQPWFGLDEQAWDYPMQVTFSSPPIELDNETRIYYGGVAKTHHGHRVESTQDRPLRCIGARAIASNRYVGYRARGHQAELLTQVLKIDNPIFLNADIVEQGWLKIELCDVNGNAIPGFELDNSVIQKSVERCFSVHWQTARWQDLIGTPIRLRIVALNAAIFALDGLSWTS